MIGKSVENQPVWERLDYSGDAIIEASAGTGKTFAIQNIVLRLVSERGFSPPEILVVTFTEKAAGELKNRIRKALADAGRLTGDFDEMMICTIHSFCKRIIDEYAFESGMPMRSEICASPAELHHRAAVDVVRGDTFRAEFAQRLDAASQGGAPSISRLIADATKGFDEPAEIKANDEFMRAVAANPSAADEADCKTMLRSLMHHRCAEIKAEDGVLTYDDLVARAADVVTGRMAGASAHGNATARLVESIRRRYRVALVDEFQDTDELQWEIFRTLFSSAGNVVDGRRGFMLVVGDPKQAIYSFRGADVGVYCRARDEIAGAANAAPMTLGETYRSTRSLVDAFNVFFGDCGAGGWFANGAAGDGIGYSQVKFPANNPKFAGLEREDEIAPVMLLESIAESVSPSGANASGVHLGNKAEALPQFAESAANEMKRLLAFSGGTAKHPLKFSYGDMCVLVGTKGDASIVRDVLARHGIPYAQYKQKGVFASAEAEGVVALFDFLARPAARGRRQALLLSPLFDVRPWQLDSLSEEFEAKFNALADRLSQFAARCDWARLFECVMNDEATALAMPAADECAFNRTRSAVRQIFDALLSDDSTRRARDCTQLSDALRKLRESDKSAAESGSLFEKESAADRVQIMTMHASKGLQFPVVFVATGFSKVNKADAQDRRRLLYVAITRAEHRVYLPWSSRAWKWECEVVKKGKSETVESYGIGSAGAELAAGGFLAEAIMRYAQKAGRDLFAPAACGDTMATPTQSKQLPCKPASQQFNSLDIRSLWNRRLRWESFTSLQAKREAVDVREDSVEREYHEKSIAPTLLPRSNISGNVFHEIMETLCKNDESCGAVGFTNAHSPDFAERLLDIIRRVMRRNALASQESNGDSTELTLARMVRTALATPLKIGDDTLVLSQIPHGDRLAEVDFVVGKKFGGAEKLVLNGKIDLVVRRGAKAYIIDWKTNSLSEYTPEKVAEAMDDANYHLQYRLYAVAAEEWLRPRGLTLGGAAYLFVRGGEHGASSGVFSTRNLDLATDGGFIQ